MLESGNGLDVAETARRPVEKRGCGPVSQGKGQQSVPPLRHKHPLLCTWV